MDDETFAETFSRILSLEDPKGFFNTEYIFPNSVELMEIYFNKLNKTNLKTREVFIADKLFPEMLKYSSNDLTEIINERNKHIRPTEKKYEIDKNIKIIKNFEDMIYKYLNGREVENTIFIEDREELKETVTMLERPYFEVDFLVKNGKKKNTIGQLLETTKRLRLELETKNYYYFQSDRFYKDDLVPKTEMKNLLNQYAKDEKLKGYTLEIKQFIDDL